MKEFIITDIEAGQRFDRYLVKCMPNVSKSFLYKMLRKKNITLNGKKADGSEKMLKGDKINIFFSDETFEKFSKTDSNVSCNIETEASAVLPVKLDILYEDANLLIVNKPSGMLSQKAKPQDISLVEYINAYLLKSGHLSELSANTFHAGVCNRLDRNTSGIVVAGKTISGLQRMTEAFRERSIAKYYICAVNGLIKERSLISGWLYKDEKNNKVTIYTGKSENIPKKAVYIETEYIPIAANSKMTFLKVHLITGRTHQIRAHLSFIGHSIIGDMKYGNKKSNDYFYKNYKIENQMLHSYELNLEPDSQLALDDGLCIRTQVPPEFLKVLKGEKLWEPGIQEVLEAQH